MSKVITHENSKGSHNQKSNFVVVDMDFDTCVKLHHPECSFEQNSDGRLDHRSQMGQFCGHDEVQLSGQYIKQINT